MDKHNICVLGGTGFVGHHLVARLNELGHAVKILTQHREKHRPLLVLPLSHVIETNVYDINRLKSEFRDFDTVINLVGILNESGHSGHGFRKAHVELSRAVLEACKQTKVKRLLHMSALNADASKGPSVYLRTKGEAEDYLHTFHGGVNVTTFRPSVIFGPDDSFFNRFANLLKIAPYFFPLACANARFAPVYIGDLVEEFIKAVEDPETYNKRINLCGPEIYTLKELVEYTAEVMQIRRKVFGIPNVIAVLQAVFMEYFIPSKPFSLDNYNSLKNDSVCNNGTKLNTSIKSIVPGYLGTKNLQHRYDEFRQDAHRQ